MSEDPKEIESEEHGPVKSLLDHLEDIRWLVLKILVMVVSSWVLCLYFAPDILLFLEHPLKLSGKDPSKFLQTFDPSAPFTIMFQLPLYGGLILSAPLVIYLIASYLLPALTKKERRYIAPAFWLGSIFFLGGVFFCYFLTLPPTLRISREVAEWLNIHVEFWTIDYYLSFVIYFMLGMGITFELPLVILVLARFGVLTHAMLSKSRSYAIVIVLIIAAFVTPSTDAFSMLIMAAPLVVMYESCIWISWLMERKRRKGESNG